jgi:hypothetical protein
MMNGICTSIPKSQVLAPRRCGLLLLAGLAAVATGCMATPEDLQHIGAYDSAVYFSGYTGYANEPIEIQAWNFRDAEWVPIALTVSDNVAVPDTDGEVFAWSVSEVVPGSCWKFQGFSHPDGEFRGYVRAVVIDTGEILDATGPESHAKIFADNGNG